MDKGTRVSPAKSAAQDPDLEKLIERQLSAMDHEVERRMRICGCLNASADLLHILALYPEFRLPALEKARRCVGCVARVALGHCTSSTEAAICVRKERARRKPTAIRASPRRQPLRLNVW